MSIQTSVFNQQNFSQNKSLVPLGVNLLSNPGRSIEPYQAALAYDLSGNGLCYGNSVNWVPTVSGSVVAVGPPMAAIDNNSLVLGGGSLSAEFADGTHCGIISTTTQTMGSGDKTFSNDIIVQGNIQQPNTTTVSGIITKAGVPFLHNFGLTNTFLGLDAGNLTTTSGTSVGIGSNALNALTSGDFIVAIGNDALLSVTTASNLTAIGQEALTANTFGEQNTAIGDFSMNTNIIGRENTAVGSSSLLFNVNGDRNNAVGAFCMQNNVSGTGNTAAGHSALINCITGNNNVSIGNDSGTDGSSCTLVGFSAGSSGSNNVAVGFESQIQNNSDAITSVGFQALRRNNTGLRNTGIGFKVSEANTVGNDNCGGGYNSLTLCTGSRNTGFGSSCLSGILAANDNIAIGYNSGSAYTGTESNNINIGNIGVLGQSLTTRIGTSQTNAYLAGTVNPGLNLNFANDLSTSTSGNITKNGVRFLCNPGGSIGFSNTFLGVGAGNFTVTGPDNIAIGDSAMSLISTGFSNIGLGGESLISLTTGITNIAIGESSMRALVGGGDNIAIGDSALNLLVSGNDNITIGSISGSNYTTNESDNILLNNFGVVGESGIMRFGMPLTHTDAYIAGNLHPELNLAFVAATSTSTTGNITKNNISFLHNYGTDNTFLGNQAGNFSSAGNFGTGIGANVLLSATSGDNNTAVGQNALSSSLSSANSTAMGVLSLGRITSGNNNTAYGYLTLQNLLTGVNNIAIGASAGTNYTSTETGNLLIGNNGTVADSNTTRIGTNQTSAFMAGTFTPSNGILFALGQTILNSYIETQINSTFTNNTLTTASTAIVYRKIGKLLTLFIGGGTVASQAAPTTFVMNSPFTSAFRPVADFTHPLRVTNAGTTSIAIAIIVAATGVMTIYGTALAGNFVTGATIGWDSFCVSFPTTA